MVRNIWWIWWQIFSSFTVFTSIVGENLLNCASFIKFLKIFAIQYFPHTLVSICFAGIFTISDLCAWVHVCVYVFVSVRCVCVTQTHVCLCISTICVYVFVWYTYVFVYMCYYYMNLIFYSKWCAVTLYLTPRVKSGMQWLSLICAIVIITILYRSDEIHDSSPSKEISYTIHIIIALL